jgi:uncharacterized protein YdaU (DUF1376 family)
MSGRPWYKRCGADFIEGTMGLSLEEKGAYSLILDLIYSHGAPIADDERWIAGVCGVSVRKWRTLRTSLISAGKITVTNGRISNARAEKEIIISSETHGKLSESGAKGGRQRAENEAARNENNNVAEGTLKQGREDKSREEEPLRGADAPEGIRKTLFDEGRRILLAANGLPDARARNLIGKWVKAAGDDAGKVLAKLRQAEADHVIDVVPWIEAALKPAKRDWRSEPEYRGVQ